MGAVNNKYNRSWILSLWVIVIPPIWMLCTIYFNIEYYGVGNQIMAFLAMVITLPALFIFIFFASRDKKLGKSRRNIILPAVVFSLLWATYLLYALISGEFV
ncbi:hypothetical protein HMF3257_30780 [Spirosoma telluris]|uniref:Uncharacterized protein n=1 Tax=Spirosoma telluris TaxID=2183553 RepID=A0A327NSN1_9BACT|nr:hypothetical protein HMF3257_30780 [Spirosoma telluris]